MRLDTVKHLLLASLVACGAAACGDTEEDDNGGADTGADLGNDVGGDTDQPPAPIQVTADITGNTTWTTGNTYILAQLTLVRDGAVLTIEPGVTVQGVEGAALVIANDGRIEAEGTATAPIVFTSSKAAGSRAPSDWGGLVLLGRAPINQGTETIEGIDPTVYGDDVQFGGTNAAHNCGTLRYVRIEFAGYTFGADNELNGLTIGGCGSATTLEYIQVHQGSDDGIEFFGGNADLKYAVVTRAQDDSLDWDMGYTGRIQFIVIQQDSTGDRGIEADNWGDAPDTEPRSNPFIYNATFIGSNQNPDQRGITWRRGTAGVLVNAIVMGFQKAGFDVDGAPSAAQFTEGNSVVNHVLFFQNGAGGTGHFSTSADGFDIASVIGGATGVVTGQDPQLGAPYSLTAPNFVPAAGSPAAAGSSTIPAAFFDTTANYLGAFEPGGVDWTAGWTAYPEN